MANIYIKAAYWDEVRDMKSGIVATDKNNLQEKDKSSDIEQQPPFSNCKYNNTLPQKKGGTKQRKRHIM